MKDMIQIYTKDSMVVTDDSIYTMQLYDENSTEFSKNVAYIDEQFFYLYRGKICKEALEATELKPGIYMIDGKAHIIPPTIDREIELYTYADKISTLNPNRIIDMINNNETILVSIAESAKMFMPPIGEDDDILKRSVKRALMEKGVDIDQYKTRFVSKNELFNLKQTLKGNSRLSMLLFDRSCDALNLKYSIVLEEADPSANIGVRLQEPIILSSNDTFDR